MAASAGSVIFDIGISRASLKEAVQQVQLSFDRSGIGINNLSFTPQALTNIKGQVERALKNVQVTASPTVSTAPPKSKPTGGSSAPSTPAGAPPTTSANKDILISLQAQKAAAQSLLATNNEQAAALAKQAANLNEALRFKRQMAQIKNAGLSAEDTKRAEQFARQISQLNRQKIRIKAEIDGAPAIAGANRFGSVLTGILQGVGQQITQILTQAFTAGIQAISQFTKASLDAAQSTRAINASLATSLGSTQEAARSYQFAKTTLDALGASVKEGTRQYAALTAASQSAGLQQQLTDEFFASFATTLAQNGVQLEQQNRAFTAASQIFAKNKLSAEELRGQLAEALPSAIGVVARGLQEIGVSASGSTEELDKLLESGSISAEQFAQAWIAGSGSVQGAIDPLNRSIGQATNKLFEFQQATGSLLAPLQQLSLDAFSAALDAVADSNAFAILQEGIDSFTKSFAASGDIAGQVKEVIASLSESAATAISSLLQSPALIQGLADGFIRISESLKTFGPAIGNLTFQMLSLGAISFVSVSEALASISPLVSLLGSGLKVLADNAGLVDFALKAMIARLIVLQGISLGASVIGLSKSLLSLKASAISATATLKALNGLTIASSFAAIKASALSAVTGISGLGVSFGGLAVAAAPIAAAVAAIGAALAVAGFIKAANDLRVLNQEVEAFRSGTQALSGGSVSLAGQIKSTIDSGLNTDEQKQKFQEQAKLAEAQIAEIERQRAELESKLAESENNRNPFSNLFGGKESAENALKSQIGELNVTQKALENQLKRGVESASGEIKKLDEVGVESAKQSAKAREEANKKALESFERDVTNAERAIEQSQQESIARIKQKQADGQISATDADAQIKAIEANTDAAIAAKTKEIERIKALESQGVITAKESADRIAQVKLEKTQLVISGLDAEIAAQEAAQKAAEEAAEKAKEAALEALDAQIGRAQELNQIREQELNIAASALERQQNLLDAQLDVTQLQSNLEQQRLSTALDVARAEGDVTGAKQAALALAAAQQQAIASEFAIKGRQLELTKEQSRIEAQRGIAAAEVAAIEARIALQKAEVNRASAEELANLSRLVELADQNVGRARDEAANVELINQSLDQKLALEQELEKAKAAQTEEVGKLIKAEEDLAARQKALAEEQINQAKKLADARTNAISSVFNAISQDASKTVEEGLAAIESAKKRLALAQQAGFFRDKEGRAATSATSAALREVQGLLERGDQALTRAAFRATENEDGGKAFADALRLAGRGDIASLIDTEAGFADIETAIRDSQVAIASKLDEVKQAIIDRDIAAAVTGGEISPAVLGASGELGAKSRIAALSQPAPPVNLTIESLSVSTPQPVADANKIMFEMAQQSLRGLG